MTETFRTERDTMGEVQVPQHALYGAQTARAVANFPISGRPLPTRVIRALGMLKAAAAAVNGRDGALDAARADAIRRAAEEVAAGLHDGHFPVDVFQTGSGTSSHMNANEVIARRAGQLLPAGADPVHPNDHVNLGQSSNDVFPSAVQLGLHGALQDLLLPELSALAAALHDFADATFDRVKTGRTHLMDAMPIRFGQEFRGYAQQCELGLARIAACLPDLATLPLGGTAVGTGVNARPGMAAAVCAELQARFGVPARETPHHFQAQACLDVVVHTSGALRTFASALYKIANDLRWMASSVVGELRIPPLQPGSSIMPAKVNPVVCEAVLMACAQVSGNDAVVAFANCQGQFELNTALPLIARNAIESAELLGNACRVLRQKCLAGMALAEDAGADVHRNPILATALNAEIGYEAAARVAKAAAASGRTVREVAAELTGLDGSTLDRLLDPARLCGEHGRTR